MARKKTSEAVEISDILQRVTRAEEKVIAMDKRQELWHAERQEFSKVMDERLKAIEDSLNRYQGFWGALVLITSAVATFFTLFKDVFMKKLGLD